MKALAPALLSAQKAMPHLTKTTEGQEGHRSYKYLPLDQLLAKVLPVLNKNGIVLFQAPIFDAGGNLGLRTTLIHESGELVSEVMPLALKEGTGMKAWGSAVSYGRRYAVLSFLGLAPDEDDDGNEADKGVERKAKYSPEQRDKFKGLIDRLQTNVPKAEGQESWLMDAQRYAQETWKKQIAELTSNQMDKLIVQVEKWIADEALPIA